MNDADTACADHMGQGIIDGFGDLPFAALPAHLPEDLGHLADTGRSDGMPHGNQAAARIDGVLAR